MKLSILIPVYNEESTIEEIIERVLEVPVEKEVIVVDDGSRDQTSVKVFRSRVIRSIPLACRRFEFCPEVTAKLSRLGHSIHEVAVGYNPRDARAGKKLSSLRDGLQAVWTLLRYRFWRPPGSADAARPAHLPPDGTRQTP
jgi:cellulose synthase/poly-beta-1,6-N-acetylglucosamine synthase-like glycosyltransferase